MAYEREHRLDDRALASLAEELERAVIEFAVPGKQTLLDRPPQLRGRAAQPGGPWTSLIRGGPGRHATIAARPAFRDFQALALRDVLSRLESQHLQNAALAAADPSVAQRVAERPHGVAERTSESPDGRGLWRAAERRAVTLYRRAQATGTATLETPVVTAALRSIGGGVPLDPRVCRKMEAILGVRLDRVRIHTGSVARDAADAANAEAFTVGEDIFLPSYEPESPECQKLLLHELVHCRQWWQGRIGPSANRIAVSQPGDPLEQEAETVVAQAFRQPARTVRANAAVSAEVANDHVPNAVLPPNVGTCHAPKGVPAMVPRLVAPAAVYGHSASSRSGPQLLLRQAKGGAGSATEEPSDSDIFRRLTDVRRSASVTRAQINEVGGEYVQFLTDNWELILSVIAFFATVEWGSKKLAAAKNYRAAAIGHTLLFAFDAVTFGISLKDVNTHAQNAWDIAWDAKGDDRQIYEAGLEWVRMAGSLLMACVAAGASLRNLLKALKLFVAFRAARARLGARRSHAEDPTAGDIAMVWNEDRKVFEPEGAASTRRSLPQPAQTHPLPATRMGPIEAMPDTVLVAVGGALGGIETPKPSQTDREHRSGTTLSASSREPVIAAAQDRLEAFWAEYFNDPSKAARTALLSNLDRVLTSLRISPALRGKLPALSDEKLRTLLGGQSLQRLASSNTKVRAQAERVAQALIDDLLMPKDYAIYISKVETVLRLREVKDLVPFTAGRGQQSDVFTGTLPRGRVLVKVPRSPGDHHLVEKDVAIVQGLKAGYAGPDWHDRVAVMDSKLGFLREGLAITLGDGLSVERLKDLKRKKLPLPYSVTPDHVSAVNKVQKDLAKNGHFLLDVHAGQVILLKGPPWIMTVDMPVVEDSPAVDHDTGRLEQVLDSVIALEKYSRATGGPSRDVSSQAIKERPQRRSASLSKTDIQSAKQKLEKAFRGYLAHPNHTDLLATVNQIVTRELGVADSMWACLHDLHPQKLAMVLQAKGFLENATSSSPLVSRQAEQLTKLYSTGELSMLMYEYYLGRIGAVLELPEVTELVPFGRGGDGTLHFLGKLDGQNAFVKMPKRLEDDHVIDGDLRALSTMMARSGPTWGPPGWYLLGRYYDSRHVIWREVVAMEPFRDSVSIGELVAMMRNHQELPFLVTPKHVAAVRDHETRLARDHVEPWDGHAWNNLLRPLGTQDNRLLISVDTTIVSSINFSSSGNGRRHDILAMTQQLADYSARQGNKDHGKR